MKIKKEPDRIKIAPRQVHQLENLNCGGVEEFCLNYQTGDTSESFIYRK